MRLLLDCFVDDDEVEFHSANSLHILAKTLEVIPTHKSLDFSGRIDNILDSFSPISRGHIPTHSSQTSAGAA